VDTQGLLLGVVVHAANIQDADSLWDLLKRVKPLYSWLRVVFADSIYNRLTALLACFLFGLTLIIVRRAAGTTGFVVQPRRWVVLPRTILPDSASSGRRWSLASLCPGPSGTRAPWPS
jgi:putative transposase